MNNNTTRFSQPKKNLSQCFLRDDYYIDAIVSAFGLQPHQYCIEIGPGRGALTEALLSTKAPLTLVEFDHALAAYWQQQQPQHPQLQVKNQDILSLALDSVYSKQPKRIIGNLPYHISSPILFHCLNYHAEICDMVFMLQKEFVERLVAPPNDSNYGRLSVMAQYHAQMEYLFEVPKTAFSPQPKVDSAVVRLIPHPPAYWPPHNAQHVDTLVRAAFQARRKTLRKNLKELISEQNFTDAGIDSSRRAETLSVAEYITLSRYLSV